MSLLFDLDGTLTDPAVGITRCIQHAMASMGRPVPPAASLRACIGPPLHESMAGLLGTKDVALVDEAIARYRERFGTIGLFENELCAGVLEGLETLARGGHRMRVVTSKPHVYARSIVEHFGLGRFFEEVHGSELSGINTDKAELLGHVLATTELAGTRPWMIGDRLHDIVAARRHGLPAVGVLWGYGSERELREARADHLVRTMAELCELVAAEGRG